MMDLTRAGNPLPPLPRSDSQLPAHKLALHRTLRLVLGMVLNTEREGWDSFCEMLESWAGDHGVVGERGEIGFTQDLSAERNWFVKMNHMLYHMFAQCMGSWADEITTNCTSLRHKSKYFSSNYSRSMWYLTHTCTGWCFEPIRKNVCLSVCHLNLDESHESPHTKKNLKDSKSTNQLMIWVS